MAMRRWVAERKRRACGDVWPIKPDTAAPPPHWPGWPEGKRFAFVLTHDVEGPDGLDRCRGLAEQEYAHGFRSSYNFIPEGPYVVPPDLRAWLQSQGFEVGVHDLQHDGHLFSSPQGFELKARRINDYLRGWEVQGFRSGFMLHNLDWLHQLNIQYDCSTFDTDPFEPQPDGVSTIFPFWVPKPPPLPGGADGQRDSGGGTRESGAPSTRSTSSGSMTGSGLVRSQESGRDSNGSSSGTPASRLPPPASSLLPNPAATRQGYVELPYTLAQDSTLFILLRERTNEIWKQKLAWIAERGGMVLLNTHPDYLDYAERGGPSVRDQYFDFLEHVKTQYTGAFWHVLPGTLAAYVRHWHHHTVLPRSSLP